MFKGSQKSRPSGRGFSDSVWWSSFERALASMSHHLLWPFNRLRLVAPITRNRKLKSEERKAIIKRGSWYTLRDCAIHLLPISITIVLLYLNFAQVFMASTGDPNQNLQLNTLQFAAKLHEILIAGSLSSIMLHCVQYELLHGDGVPIGALLAGFQVTNISSLWSPGLWATASIGAVKPWRLQLLILMVLSVTLAAIVGPASAILMLPTSDWWEIGSTDGSTDFAFPSGIAIDDPRIFVGANESTLWPSYVSTDSFPSDCNNSVAVTQPVYCPLGGLITLLDQASPGLWDNADGVSGLDQWNITLPISVDLSTPNGVDKSPEIYYQYLEGSRKFNSSSGTGTSRSLTQTTSLVGDLLLATLQDQLSAPAKFRWSLSLKNNSQIPAPTIRTLCLELDPSLNLLFPLQDGTTWSGPISKVLDAWNNSTTPAVVWFDSPDLGKNSPSIGIVYAVGSNDTITSILSCSVFASWEPEQLYIDPGVDNDFHSPSTSNSPNVWGGETYLAGSKAVKFDIEWADKQIPANTTIGALTSKMNDPSPVEDRPIENSFEVVVSIFLTSVLSRIGANGPYTCTSSLPWAGFNIFLNGNYKNPNVDKSVSTEFKATLLQNGYSYSTRGITRRLAAGILLVHSIIAVIYMIVVIRSGWSCLGLKSLAEIVVLALNSNPTTILDNTCAGISRFGTYKHVVKVRAVYGKHIWEWS